MSTDAPSPPGNATLVPVPQLVPAGAGEEAAGWQGASASTAASAAAAVADDERLLCAAYAGLAEHAASLERRAIELDRAGQAEAAVQAYRETAEQLTEAVTACPDGLLDKVALARHTGEVMGRVVYLQSLGGAKAAPVEEHLGQLRLTLGKTEESDLLANSSQGASQAAGAEAPRKSRAQQALSAAAVGGAAGLLVVHAPLAAVALAAGAAYATTREDTVGQAARKVGDAGIVAAKEAKAFDQEHHISERVHEKCGDAIVKAKAVDEKYKVVEKTQAAAVSSWETLSELDRKHEVTRKLGQGAAAATKGVLAAGTKVSGLFSRKPTTRQGEGGYLQAPS